MAVASPETVLARESCERLSRAVRGESRPALSVTVDGSSDHIPLPSAAARLLMDGLAELAEGRAVQLTRTRAELNTAEAAELLHLTHAQILHCIESGRLTSRTDDDGQTRIGLTDLLEYRAVIDADREAAIHRLVAEAQELDMGY